MQLNLASCNIIKSITRKSNQPANIVYECTKSLLDQTIFSLPYRFYIMEDNKFDFNTANVINLPEKFYGTYDYQVLISNSLEKCANGNSISNIFHIPTIVIIDEIKNFKKEDRYIINQKTKNLTKVFLSQESYEAMDKPQKSFVVPFGVNTAFKLPNNNAIKKDVVFLDNSGIAQQIKNILLKEELKCDTISLNLNISTANFILNQYKFCIDLTNKYKYNLLCALAAGCQPITLNHNPRFCPYIHHVNTPHDIVHFIKHYQPISGVSEYINDNFNYQSFSNTMESIINETSKEVFIQ